MVLSLPGNRPSMATIPADYRDLLTGTQVGTFATVLPDGTPHQTVTWVDYDGEHVLINSAEGRRKVKNVRRHPRASVLVIDPEDPGRYLSVHGEIVSIDGTGAAEHANELGQRYYDEPDFMSRYGDDVVRVILHLSPDSVITH